MTDEMEKFNSGGFNVPAASQEEADAREEVAKAHARREMEQALRDLAATHKPLIQEEIEKSHQQPTPSTNEGGSK
jgi:hypothetical protein